MFNKLILILVMLLVTKMGFSQDLSKIPEYRKNLEYSGVKLTGDKKAEADRGWTNSLKIELKDKSEAEKITYLKAEIQYGQNYIKEMYVKSLKYAGAIEHVCNRALGDVADRDKEVDVREPLHQKSSDSELEKMTVDQLLATYASSDHYTNEVMLQNFSLSSKYHQCLKEKIKTKCEGTYDHNSKDQNDSEFGKDDSVPYSTPDFKNSNVQKD